MKILADEVEKRFLPYVRMPGRYIGGEINQSKKDLDKCELTVALCFPDVYEIGMSHTGIAILYHILNSIENIAAEKVFAPWADAEEIMRDKGLELFSLESKAAVSSFDIIGFSLTNELCYTNVLNMVDLAGLNIRSGQRSENDPIVIAGGSMANCCEPMAEFIDLFVLGEAEEAILELANLLIDFKKTGKTKKQFLFESAKRFNWCYVQSVDDRKIKKQNAVIEDFENAPVPTKPIVPFVEAVHERVSVEIMRGCPGRCRFCQASYCRRPIRYRSIERIFEIAKESYKSTGFDTVSLLSLSTADYPQLEELVTKLTGYFEDKHVGVSVPSLRVDEQLKLLPKMAKSVRKSGLTIAVEAASEELRQTINKPIKDEHLFEAVEAAYKAGWQKLKLYFMVGLPGEEEEDIARIVELSNELALLRKQISKRPADINVAVSWFVPKAHTPFGWVGQQSRSYFENAKQIILERKKELRARYLNFKFHNIERSLLESVIGRGDGRLCDVIESAWKKGARFDLWDECFDNEIWKAAFAEHGINIEESAAKEFNAEEILPWEHLGGPDKEYLLEHLRQAKITEGK
ncbi:MAG: TIGR03960 family B12-binding radical SAM protein [Sedimentisphaerales bacterium]|nr:TIGR03960 family B12-binding radical SAM protein [Sedimentisphaerales bacterium]